MRRQALDKANLVEITLPPYLKINFRIAVFGYQHILNFTSLRAAMAIYFFIHIAIDE